MALFSHGSPFMRFMERLADVFLLNMLWLAFSLPLVTVGASTLAAFRVALKMAAEEDPPVARTFLAAFKEDFLQGTALWALNAAVLYGLYIEWQFALKSPDPPIWLLVAAILSSALSFCAFAYAYPLAARYRNAFGMILLNSFRISLKYRGKTLILLLVLALEIGVFSWNLPMAALGVLVGPMIMVYTASGVSLRIFGEIEKASGGPGSAPEDRSSGGA